MSHSPLPPSTFFFLFVLMPDFAYSRLSLVSYLNVRGRQHKADWELRACCGPCLVMSGQGPSSFLGETSDVTNSRSLCLVTFPRENPEFPVWELKVKLNI